MDFKKAIVKAISRDTEYTTALVKYDKELYCIINNMRYPIVYDITNHSILYSLPTNNKYKAWTKRHIDGKPNPIAFKAWSPIKPGQRIKGKIKDNAFQLKSSNN